MAMPTLVTNAGASIDASGNWYATKANVDLIGNSNQFVNIRGGKTSKVWNGDGSVIKGGLFFLNTTDSGAQSLTVTLQYYTGGSWVTATGDSLTPNNMTVTWTNFNGTTTKQGTWIYIQFPDVLTEVVGTGNYRFYMDNSPNNAYFRYDLVATTNFAKIVVLNSTSALGSGQVALACGGYNSAGANPTAATIKWDLNTGTTYASICVANGATIQPPDSPSGNTYSAKITSALGDMQNGLAYSIWVQNGGNLLWDYSTATSFTLELAPATSTENLIQVDAGGTFRIGPSNGVDPRFTSASSPTAAGSWRDTLSSTVEAGGTSIVTSGDHSSKWAANDWLSLSCTDQRGHTELVQIDSISGTTVNLKSGGGIGTTGSELAGGGSNTDFETDLTGWTVGGVGSPSQDRVLGGDSGTYCLQLTSGSTSAFTSCNFNVTAGVSYLVRLRFKKVSSVCYIKVGTSANAGDIYQSPVVGDTDWTFYQFIFTALTTTTYYLTFTNTTVGASQTSLWDTVSVKQYNGSSGGVAYRHKSGAEVCNLTHNQVIKMTGAGTARISDVGTTTLCGVQCGVILVTGPELILNGGFETLGGGGADIWLNWSEYTNTGAIANETTIVNSGSNAAKLTAGAAAQAYIESPNITVTPGATYRLVAANRAGTDGYPGALYCFDATNSIALFTANANSTTSYANTTLYFTIPLTPSPCTTIRISCRAPVGNGKIAYFDDVSLVQVAVPTQGLTTSTTNTAALTAASLATSITSNYCSFLACGGSAKSVMYVTSTTTIITVQETAIYFPYSCTGIYGPTVGSTLTNISIARMNANAIYGVQFGGVPLIVTGVNIYDDGGLAINVGGFSIVNSSGAALYLRGCKAWGLNGGTTSNALRIYTGDMVEVKNCVFGSDGTNTLANYQDIYVNASIQSDYVNLYNTVLASPTRVTLTPTTGLMNETYRGSGVFVQRLGTSGGTGIAGRYYNVVLNGTIADPTTAGTTITARSGHCVVITPLATTAGYTCDWEFYVPVTGGVVPTVTLYIRSSNSTSPSSPYTGPTVTWTAYDTKNDNTILNSGGVPTAIDNTTIWNSSPSTNGTPSNAWQQVTITPNTAPSDTGVMRIKLCILGGSTGGSIGVDDVAVN